MTDDKGRRVALRPVVFEDEEIESAPERNEAAEILRQAGETKRSDPPSVETRRRRMVTITLPTEEDRQDLDDIAAALSDSGGEEVAPTTAAMMLLMAAIEAWKEGILTVKRTEQVTVTQELTWKK